MSCRRPCAALLVVAALAVAACGSDVSAENAYVDDVQRAQETFVTRFSQSLARLTPTSKVSQDRATLREFARVTQDFDKGLARIKAPDRVRDEHRALVATVAGFRRQFVRAEAKLADGTADERARVRTELSGSVGETQTRITKAIGDINAALRD